MPVLFILFALLRVAILMAIALAAAAVIYYRHRSHQLELKANDLHTRLQQLQQRDAQRTESFATTVHELRAPLTSIRGALVLLSAGAIVSLDQRAANLLRIAASNTGRLVRLIDELLELERMESATAQIELRPCSLNEVLSQAIETMSPMAEEAAIEIETLPTPDTPLQFAGDASRMVQVLCNLLSNAIKFSPHGSVIKLGLRGEPHHLVLRVQDQGRGIPGDKLEAVFGRFVRVGPPLSAYDDPSHSGMSAPACSGLGLAISRSLVSQHGGTLHAERNDSTYPGRPGTTFVLRLPRLITGTVAAATLRSPLPRDTVPAALLKAEALSRLGERNRPETPSQLP
jgi:signal transduction histidine kinase